MAPRITQAASSSPGPAPRAVRAFYSDHFVLPLPDGHRFPMAKYARLRERRARRGRRRAGALCEAPARGWDDAPARAHAGLRRRGRHRHAAARGAAPHRVPVVPGDGGTLARSVGATWRRRGGARSSRTAVASTSPAAPTTRSPIAARATASSTTSRCAARCCSATARCRRIAVVDCDVHQGNGTAAIFRADPTVFTFSMHGAKNFPFRKEDSDLDVTCRTAPATRSTCGAREHLPRVLDAARRPTSSSTWPAPTRTKAIGSAA